MQRGYSWCSITPPRRGFHPAATMCLSFETIFAISVALNCLSMFPLLPIGNWQDAPLCSRATKGLKNVNFHTPKKFFRWLRLRHTAAVVKHTFSEDIGSFRPGPSFFSPFIRRALFPQIISTAFRAFSLLLPHTVRLPSTRISLLASWCGKL